MLDLFSGEFSWTGSLNKKILFGNDYHDNDYNDNDYNDNVLTYSCQAPRIATLELPLPSLGGTKSRFILFS